MAVFLVGPAEWRAPEGCTPPGWKRHHTVIALANEILLVPSAKQFIDPLTTPSQQPCRSLGLSVVNKRRTCRSRRDSNTTKIYKIIQGQTQLLVTVGPVGVHHIVYRVKLCLHFHMSEIEGSVFLPKERRPGLSQQRSEFNMSRNRPGGRRSTPFFFSNIPFKQYMQHSYMITQTSPGPLGRAVAWSSSPLSASVHLSTNLLTLWAITYRNWCSNTFVSFEETHWERLKNGLECMCLSWGAESAAGFVSCLIYPENVCLRPALSACAPICREQCSTRDFDLAPAWKTTAVWLRERGFSFLVRCWRHRQCWCVLVCSRSDVAAIWQTLMLGLSSNSHTDGEHLLFVTYCWEQDELEQNI